MTTVPTDAELQKQADERGAVFVNESKLKESIKQVDFYVHPGSQLTVCIITMQNGYTVTGESACADPKMFNQQIGETFAFAAAERKIWPLLGYALKQELFLLGSAEGKELTFQQRVEVEAKELNDKLTKLKAFIGGSEQFNRLPFEERERLQKQENAMSIYLDTLNERIANF